MENGTRWSPAHKDIISKMVKETCKNIGRIKECLNSQFIERKEVIDIVFLSILSRQHSILIGGPGLAKTAVLKAIIRHISGFKLFDFQMTPLTKVEELFSWNNSSRTGIDNCDIAFIDEFFKGSSPVLNSLLGIMNERVIYNPHPKKIPLLCLFATSNERPDKSIHIDLLPLYDRFLLRKEIFPINGRDNFRNLLCSEGEYYDMKATISKEDLGYLSDYAQRIPLRDSTLNLLYRIRENLKEKQVSVSDRRWKDIVKVLKTGAALRGKDEVETIDITHIESSLWTYCSDIRTVKTILKKELSS